MAPFSSSQDVKTWFFSALAPMFAPKPPRGGCTGTLCTLVFWTKAEEVKEMHYYINTINMNMSYIFIHTPS